MNRVISPVAIDLGAKNTGLLLTQYAEGGALTREHSKAVTLVMPEEGGKMTWSQQARTATRHRLRSNKRRKMAKRLLKLSVQQLLTRHDVTLTDEQWTQCWEALCGLLNRRGYNRLETELDEDSLTACEPDWFADALPEFFVANTNLLDQWFSLSQDPSKLRLLSEHKLMELGSKELKRQHLSDFDSSEKNKIATAFIIIRDGAHSLLQELDYGHKHRREYLAAIESDIERDSRLTAIRQHIGSTALWCLIGNISNLQLRCSRWYFNDINMKERDIWQPEKLKIVLNRWLQYWRPATEEEKQRQQESLSTLEKHSDVLEALCHLDPTFTIPPYEDQDNRRPPKDQTLWLNPLALEQRYGNSWQIWAQKLLRSNPNWDDGLDLILDLYDRKSRLPKEVSGKRIEPKVTSDQLRYSYLLQRLLDRSRKLDPYALRKLARNIKTRSSEASFDVLAKDLGTQHTGEFIDFCHRYFSEVDMAKQGLWRANLSNLLERSDLNPPHKKKILYRLVGAILGEEFTKEQLAGFRSKVWAAKVLPRGATLKGACTAIEECRKEYGNLFKERLRRLRYRIERLEEPVKSLKGDDKVIWNVWEKTQHAVDAIANHLGHSDDKKKTYANPFSMSQLYNLMERDRNGFSNTTLAAHLENAWRMTEEVSQGEKSARCSRLSADSVRPFDGLLGRLLERQAWEIAKLKADQLVNSGIKNSAIDLPILIEENRFAFSEGLIDVKKAGSAKRKKFTEKLNQQRSRWEDKETRIRKASKGLCPYTGKPLSDHGELDHILPRAASMARNGTVYNSEANLIWCTRTGNQTKGVRRYHLEDLHPNYLKVQFGTGNVLEVSQFIETTVLALPDDFIFDALESDEKKLAVRHALFLPSESAAYKKAEWRLASQMGARVNGTQAWLVRAILEQLDSLLQPWAKAQGNEISYSAARINAEEVSSIRARLGEFDSKFSKLEFQPAASHAIDALCVLAAAASTPKTMPVLAQGEGLTEHMDWLVQAMPINVAIQRVERKPRYHKADVSGQTLFKDGIYGENFLPVWVGKHGIRIGFDPIRSLVCKGAKSEDNLYSSSILVKGSKPELFIEYIAPFLKHQNILTKALESEKPQRFVIDGNLAFLHFQKVAKQPCIDHELLQADALEALYFNTSKKNVWKRIYNEPGKKFKAKEDILRAKDFTLKPSFSIGKGKDALVSLDGQLYLPAMLDWQRFISQPEIASQLGCKSSMPENTREICESFFKVRRGKVQHKRVRREYSLPVVEAPSGGFRIRRKGPNGQNVWQMQPLEGTPSCGFTVDVETVNWNRLAQIPHLRKSENIVGKGERYLPPPKEVVLFDKWLTIQNDQIPAGVEMSMAPGTKGRRYIRISQPYNQFSEWLNEAYENIPETALLLPGELKLNPGKYFNNHLCDLLGKPRSNLFIEHVGEKVTYWYIVESSNQAMKAAYQKAYSLSINSKIGA
mgnify:CR=1 FL=1